MAITDLSMRDLTDEANLTQARHELHRAQETKTFEALAEWAAKWGDAALKAVEEGGLKARDDERDLRRPACGYFDE